MPSSEIGCQMLNGHLTVQRRHGAYTLSTHKAGKCRAQGCSLLYVQRHLALQAEQLLSLAAVECERLGAAELAC